MLPLDVKSGEEYVNEYCAWYLTEDGFAVSFMVGETRSADENYMVTEDTLKTAFGSSRRIRTE